MKKPIIDIQRLPSLLKARLQNSGNLRKIAANTSWLFLDRILRMGVGLLVTVWVARYLGPGQFGSLSYAFAFVALFSALANLGLDGIVVREIVRDPSSESEVLGTAFFLKFAGGVLALLICSYSAIMVRSTDTTTQWLVFITAAGLVFQSFDTIDFYFQSQVKSKYTVYSKNIAFLIVSAIKVILIVKGASIVAFAWAGLAEIILGSVGLVISFKANHKQLFNWQINIARGKRLLADSWPYILSGVSVTISLKINQLLLGQMLDAKSVGIYSAAARISEVWYFIPIAIVISTQPALIQMRERDEKRFQRNIERLLSIQTTLAYLIAIVMTFMSNWIVKTLFGSSFVASGPVLAIHIWAAVFVFVGCTQNIYWLAENLQQYALFFTIISAGVSIIASIVLIPLYRENGAAFGTLMAYAIPNTVVLALFKRTRPLFFVTMRSLASPIIFLARFLFLKRHALLSPVTRAPKK